VGLREEELKVVDTAEITTAAVDEETPMSVAIIMVAAVAVVEVTAVETVEAVVSSKAKPPYS